MLIFPERRGARDGHATRDSAQYSRRFVVAEVNVCVVRDVCEQRAQGVFGLLLRDYTDAVQEVRQKFCDLLDVRDVVNDCRRQREWHRGVGR